jgi:hypothetical protein
MALQVQERNAAIGAAAAAGFPVALNAAGINIEDHIVNVADMVFEGDVGSASFVSGVGFTLLGGALIAAAWVGPLNGTEGMLAMGIGVGLFAIGVQSFDVARRQ